MMGTSKPDSLQDIDLDALVMDESARAARWRVIHHEQRRRDRLWEAYRRSLAAKNRGSFLSRVKRKLLGV
jgi:hypothetical protein